MLSDVEYERGNVRRNMKGHSVGIGPDAADRIPQGRRGQRPGLLYDESYRAFSPSSWPVVCRPTPDSGGARFVLGGSDGTDGTTVDVAYRRVDERMAR